MPISEKRCLAELRTAGSPAAERFADATRTPSPSSGGCAQTPSRDAIASLSSRCMLAAPFAKSAAPRFALLFPPLVLRGRVRVEVEQRSDHVIERIGPLHVTII